MSASSIAAIRWTLLAVGIVLVLLGAGYRYYVSETRWIYEKQAREIEAIGALKIDQIVQWRKERHADAARTSSDPLLRDALEAWLGAPARHVALERDLREALRLERDAYDYHDVLIVGPDGRLLLAAGDASPSIGPPTLWAVDAAQVVVEPVFSETFRAPAGEIFLDTVAPILGDDGRALGVLVLRSDPERYLYPSIQSWPVPSQSSEILIVERDGDEVRVLNPLRHRPDAALSLEFSLEEADLAAVRAALGQRGPFESRDYRGVAVLAATSPVPHSDWALVAKIDADEVLAEARYRAGVAVSFTGLGAIVAVLGVAFAYRRRQAGLYRSLYLTEREQSEAQGRFRTVLYSIGEAVISTDREGRVRQLNPVAEQLTGWAEAEAVGEPLEAVFRIADEQTLAPREDLAARVLREGRALDLANHTLLIGRDGADRPIAASAAPIRDGTGAVTGVVLVFRDQTGERAARQELESREARYRQLFASNPHPMWVYDIETLAFLEVNDAAVAHYGYSRDEFLAMTIPSLHVEHDVPHLLEAVSALAEQKSGDCGGGPAAWSHRRKDGSVLDVEITSHVMDYGGRRAELVLANDVTEIKRANDALRASEERFRSIVENETECVQIVSVDGRLLDMNPAGLRMVEADARDQVLQRPVAGLVHPDDREGFLRVHDAVLRGDVEGLEFRIVGLKGTVRWVETHSTPLRDARGDVVSVLSVTRDVTKRREAEERLRQSEALLRIAGGAARLGGWSVDFASKRVTWSDEVRAIHELPPGSTPTIEEAARFYTPEWRSVVTEALLACTRDGTAFDVEAELVTATGRRIWVRVVGHAEHDADGNVTGIVGALQDLTERKQAETDVRRLAERLTATLESITDAFVMLDRDWRFSYVNPEGERLLQKTREQLVGRVMWDEFPESVGTVFERSYRQAAAEQRPAEFEAFYPPLDTWFEIHAYPSDEGLAIYFRDISERRLAREKERADEERLLHQRNALITLTGRDALDATDLPASLRRITEAAARTLGVARVSIWRFDPDHTSIHSEDQFELGPERHSDGAELTQAAYPAYFRALLEEEVVAADDAPRDPRTREFADDYLRPLGITSMLDVPIRLGGELDGVLCHEHIGSPRTWSSDEKTFAVAVANLVSLTLEQWERTRAEGALRHRVEIEGFIARASVRFLSISADEIDAAVEEALAGIGAVTGADRSYVFQLDETNGTVTNTHEWCAPGIEPQKHVVENLPQDAIPWWMSKLRNFESIYLYQPEDLPPEATVERELMVEQEIQSLLVVPIFWRRQLRGFLGFETVCAPRVWSQEDRQALEVLANTVSLALERTHAEATREQLEAQLLQSQKLEAVGRLAGGVAHDFNNMLTVILGHADIALERLAPADPIRTDLEGIVASGQRSANLIRQLLAFARKQTIAPQVLDLNETIASALQMLGRLIGENIELVWRPGRGVRCVEIDPAQLDQILANLAVNARDAISGVGRIVIETAIAELDEAYCSGQVGLIPGSYTVIEFSDTGCGMDKASLARAFEPFFTTKAPGQGTGLGLATVYGILKQNRGHITVYSEPSQGTTFRIYLPSQDADCEEGDAPTRSAAVPTGTETILLVEDEAVLLKLVSKQLAQLGYDVLTAGLPQEAIELAESHPGRIHLLMTDVIMPDMNGRDLWNRIHGIRPETKSLFMSGYTADIVSHQGVLDEGITFLQKPFTRAILAEKVREALAAETVGPGS